MKKLTNALNRLSDAHEQMRNMVSDGLVIGDSECRSLVDLFYQFQELRKATNNQARSNDRMNVEAGTLHRIAEQMQAWEDFAGQLFLPYLRKSPAATWLLAQPGIGPILAANMLAHLSVNPWKCGAPHVLRLEGDRCSPSHRIHEDSGHGCGHVPVLTAGGFWRYAGLDPTVKWEKGQKRPWNARLKVACWKASDSWVKLGERTDGLYPVLYRQRKALEIERDARGDYREQATAALSEKKIGKGTAAHKAYADGHLPPAHLDARARRYAMKIFLSHLHHVMYECEFGEPPPRPYAMEHAGHAHYIPPPGWDAMRAEAAGAARRRINQSAALGGASPC